MLAHGTYIDDLLIPVLAVLAFTATTVRWGTAPDVGSDDPCPYCEAPSDGGERCPRCGFRLERYAASQEGGPRES